MVIFPRIAAMSMSAGPRLSARSSVSGAWPDWAMTSGRVERRPSVDFNKSSSWSPVISASDFYQTLTTMHKPHRTIG